MNILFIMKTLRYDGGVETSVAALVNALVERGHNVIIAAFCDPDENHLIHRLRIEEDHFIYLGKITAFGIRPSHFTSVLRILYRHKIDVVHTHLFHAGVVGRVAAAFHSTKTVATEHSTFFHWWRFYHYAIDRFLARRTTALTAVSRSAAGTLAARTAIYPNKINVIPNGVDTSIFSPEPGFPRSDNVITVSGRFEYAKNIKFALQILQEMKKSDPEVQLHLLGDGSMRAEVIEMIASYGLQDDVILKRPAKDFASVLRGTGVLLVTSHWEGLPMVILEAYATGTAVSGTAVPGVMDVVQHNHTGVLLDPNDPKRAAEALMNLRQDHAFRQRLIDNASAYVATFGADAVAEKYIDLYEDILS